MLLAAWRIPVQRHAHRERGRQCRSQTNFVEIQTARAELNNNISHLEPLWGWG